MGSAGPLATGTVGAEAVVVLDCLDARHGDDDDDDEDGISYAR